METILKMLFLGRNTPERGADKVPEADSNTWRPVLAAKEMERKGSPASCVTTNERGFVKEAQGIQIVPQGLIKF